MGRWFFLHLGFLVRIIQAFSKVLPLSLCEFVLLSVRYWPWRWVQFVRYVMISRVCQSCGSNVMIADGVVLKNMRSVVLGDNISIHQGCYIDGLGGVEVGSNVSIAHHVSILTFNHSWEDDSLPIKYNPSVLNSVKIGSDVWVGCAVRIMPGIIINDRSVIAAGAVVTSAVPSNSIYGGVPARKIREI